MVKLYFFLKIVELVGPKCWRLMRGVSLYLASCLLVLKGNPIHRVGYIADQLYINSSLGGWASYGVCFVLAWIYVVIGWIILFFILVAICKVIF